MKRIHFHRNLHFILAFCIALTIPIGSLTPLLIALFFINWLVEGGLIQKFKLVSKNKLAITFISLYLIHIVGMLYTSNIDSGLFDLEVKLSLLIFPIVITSKPFTKKEIGYIFVALIIGLVLASLYLLSRAVSIYFIENENAFFYQNLSVVLHTSYLSMYLNMAIVWILLMWFQLENNSKTFSKVTSLLLIAFFSIMIILLSSKAGIATLILIFLGVIVYFLLVKKRYLVGLLGVGILVVSLFFVNYFAPKIMLRVNNFVEAITTTNDTETEESTSNRLLIWSSANEIVKSNFATGVGTGDVKDALNKEYENRGIENALKHNFNAHNEFYQVFIAVGIIGFLILIIGIFYPLKIAYGTKDYLYLAFLLIIIFNFLSESMLETKAGVMFYAFFNALLCFRASDKEDV